MSRAQIEPALTALRKLYRGRTSSLAVMRRTLDATSAVTPLPPGVTRTHVELAGRRAAWLHNPEGDEDRILLYLHGGGFVLGSIKTHSALAARLGQAGRARTLLLEYRLAPEHPFPAALEDATRAYEFLLEEGVSPRRIAVAGDSAGGGLALAALVSWRDASLPLPACCVLMSPWVDLSCSAPSLDTFGPSEPLVSRAWCEWAAHHYAADHDLLDPRISPLQATLEHLPPLLIQAGGHDGLLDDAIRLRERAEQAHVPTTYQVWPEMPHVFQVFGAMLDEADEAVEQAGRFIRKWIDAHEK